MDGSDGVDLKVNDDGLTMADIESMCVGVGEGDDEKDQDVVYAVLTVSTLYLYCMFVCEQWSFIYM